MNRVKYIFPLVLLLGLLLSSCGTTTHVKRMSPFNPDRVELRINMNDLKLLGETEISVSYNKYLGVITVLNDVNGVAYDPADKKTTRIEGVCFGFSKLANAAYKVVDDFPGASYFKIVYTKTVTNRLFLGKEIKQTALIRAYSFEREK